MYATKYLRLLLFVVIIIQGCNFSDSTTELGDGYFYRNEGSTIKDILCKVPEGGQIPSNILDFAYNDEFIIAKQTPQIPQDPLYDKTYEYINGTNVFYYWLIIKKDHSVLGPFDLISFTEERDKYKIPKNMILR
ncbi:MAG: DUF3997 domain-containing protein [Marinifilaceae bacterium]